MHNTGIPRQSTAPGERLPLGSIRTLLDPDALEGRKVLRASDLTHEQQHLRQPQGDCDAAERTPALCQSNNARQ